MFVVLIKIIKLNESIKSVRQRVTFISFQLLNEIKFLSSAVGLFYFQFVKPKILLINK